MRIYVFNMSSHRVFTAQVSSFAIQVCSCLFYLFRYVTEQKVSV